LPKPQPGELDREFAGGPVAGLLMPWSRRLSPLFVRRAGESEIAANLGAIVEGPENNLADQLLSADRADAFEVDELHDLGFDRAGAAARNSALLLASSAANCC